MRAAVCVCVCFDAIVGIVHSYLLLLISPNAPPPTPPTPSVTRSRLLVVSLRDVNHLGHDGVRNNAAVSLATAC